MDNSKTKSPHTCALLKSTNPLKGWWEKEPKDEWLIMPHQRLEQGKYERWTSDPSSYYIQNDANIYPFEGQTVSEALQLWNITRGEPDTCCGGIYIFRGQTKEEVMQLLTLSNSQALERKYYKPIIIAPIVSKIKTMMEKYDAYIIRDEIESNILCPITDVAQEFVPVTKRKKSKEELLLAQVRKLTKYYTKLERRVLELEAKLEKQPNN